MEISRVGVVGCGLMGSGIVEVCARAGYQVIASEVDQAFDIHESLGSILGGVHFELTGEDVSECIGGARGLAEEDLNRAYYSDVDPRLNYEQAMEMALLIARHMTRRP